MTSLPRRFRRNVISSYLTTATLALVGLVMTPVLVRGLGAEGYGIWALVGSLILYFELLEFGLGKAAPKYVAEFAARGDADRLRRAIATAFWILVVPGLVAILLGAATAAVFPGLFGVSPQLSSAAQVLVLLVIFDLAVSIPGDTFGGTLMGLQRFDLINATLIVVAVAQAIAWAIVLASGGGLVMLGVVTVALSLVGQLARYLIVRRLLPGLSLSRRQLDRSLVRPFAGLSAWFALIDVSIVVLSRIDTVVVGLSVGVAAAGIYAIGQKLILLVDQLIVPATKMFFPHSSELDAQQDPTGLRASLITGTRLSLAVAIPMCLVMATLAERILRAWVGRGFNDAGLVVVFLAAALVITSLTRTSLLMLQGMGRARVPAIMIVAEAVLNLGLSVGLAQVMGLQGVALATLIAAAVVNLGIFFPYMCRQFELPAARFLTGIARAHLPPLAVGLAVAWLVSRASPSGIPLVLLSSLAIIAAYVSIFALTGLDRVERRRMLTLVRGPRSRPASQAS